MLTFISRAKEVRKAEYLCECGKTTIAFTANVNRGHTSSCGCLRKKANSQRFTTHGHKSHGKRTKVYVAWMNMRARCSDPKRPGFKHYGGRGIGVCDRWQHSFEAFLEDMGEPAPGLTLDRIDNSKGYSKENCRWVTMSVQALNKRNCVRYELNGKSQTLSEWSRENGIGRLTMYKRIQSGVPLSVALTFTGNLRSRAA